MTLFARWALTLAIVVASLALAVPVGARVVQPLLEYGFGLFPARDWTVFAQEDQRGVLLLWRSRDWGRSVRIEYAALHDPSEVHHYELGISQYVSTFEQCQNGPLTLQEMSSGTVGARYHARVWIKWIPPDHVLRVVATFDPRFDDQLDVYARRLFPELPSCAVMGIA
jgi:hypothetical protein